MEYYASPSNPDRVSRRGHPYCEILLGDLVEDGVTVEVWGTQLLGPCVPEDVAALDLEDIQAEYDAAFVVVNGPRLSAMDAGLFLLPERPHRAYGELETQLIASIELDVAEILENSGVPAAMLPSVLETLDAALLAHVDPYEESTVQRTTVFEYWAGSEAYELVSPEGVVYVMQSVSNMVDPDLTLDDLPTLDTRLSLPEGWTYQARTLETDLVLVIFGEAIVITDDLGNAYQRRRRRDTGATETNNKGDNDE